MTPETISNIVMVKILPTQYESMKLYIQDINF